MQAAKSSWIMVMRVGLVVGATTAMAVAFWSPHKFGTALSEIALLLGSVIGLLLFLTLDYAQSSFFSSTEVKERKKAEKNLQELSGRLLRLKDEEQHALAQKLHESTAQLLAASVVHLERAQKIVLEGNSSKASQLLVDSSELVEKAIVELRTISYLLYPLMLDDLGLTELVPDYAASFSSRSEIHTTVEIEADFGRLPRELELTIFRTVQEALNNLHGHSGSHKVNIVLRRNRYEIAVEIRDDGYGINLDTADLSSASTTVGVGVAAMRERVRQLGGRLEIESDSRGTLIRATLPFSEPHAARPTTQQY
jgi:signal transduction histidine kinase